MIKTKKNTAFYIEIISLLLLMLFGISVLVQVFGKAQQMGNDAKALSVTVPLARNAAEVFSACDDTELISEMLSETSQKLQSGAVVAFYDINGLPTTLQQAYYTLEMNFTEKEFTVAAQIKLMHNLIEIYTLDTEKYINRS